MKHIKKHSYSNIAFVLILLLMCTAVFGATRNVENIPPAEVPERHDVGYVPVSDPLAIRGVAALASWDLAAADNVAEQMKTEGKWSSRDALAFRSRLAFFHGDYALSSQIYEELNSAYDVKDPEKFGERVKKLAEIMKGVKSFESENFIVRVTPGPDEILIYDALETLEKAYDILTVDLDVKPTSKVVLEVFPSFESFELASGLSEENVETTGTVAVCKFARLIVTTPRALMRGYEWRDTIAHEFVHYLIFLRAGYNCPIWLHEGIAKYEENRWRNQKGGQLSPISQSLLAAAIKRNNLITFKEMDPSFALLPSATAGQLAFAEVVYCVKYLVHRGGFKLVLNILDRLRKDNDYEKAISAELGEPYPRFMAKWKKFMAQSDLESIEGVDIVGIKIRKTGTRNEEEEEEPEEEFDENDPADRYSRLGKLLQNEGRDAAALIEYKKALEIQPNNVYLMNKTAYMHMRLKNFDDAIPLLEKIAHIYPDAFPATYKRLGIIYRHRRDYEKAKEYFELSTDINPYDHEVQSALWKIYSELSLEDERLEAQRKLAILVPMPTTSGPVR